MSLVHNCFRSNLLLIHIKLEDFVLTVAIGLGGVDLNRKKIIKFNVVLLQPSLSRRVRCLSLQKG